jgi:hypothetical protein
MMFEAISRTLPLGSVSFEQTRSPSGEVYIWLDPREGDKLMAERRQGGKRHDSRRICAAQSFCESRRSRPTSHIGRFRFGLLAAGRPDGPLDNSRVAAGHRIDEGAARGISLASLQASLRGRSRCNCHPGELGQRRRRRLYDSVIACGVMVQRTDRSSGV